MSWEYQIIEGFGADDLTADVNAALAEGWEFWGNPFGFQAETEVSDIMLYQAMIRRVETPSDDRVFSKETARGVPAGFTFHVPETPQEVIVSGDVLDEETKAKLEEFAEAHDQVLVPVRPEFSDRKMVESAVPLFSFLSTCSCGNRPGEDPHCPIHLPNGRIR